MSGESRESPPIVAVGGVLTVKQLRLLYKRILDLDDSSDVPSAWRFVPPHQRGTGEVDVTREKTRENLLRVHDAVGGRKMLLVGHSLGGLIATMYTYEHPETVAGVICLAGAQEGVKHDTLAMRGLKKFINNPAATDLVHYDSGFMREHRERVRTEWPADVPLHAVSTAVDPLLPPPHGFWLEPNDQPTTNRLVMPWGFRWTVPGQTMVSESPDNTETIPTLYWTGHTNMPLSPPVIDYVRSVRDQLAGQPAPQTGILQAAG